MLFRKLLVIGPVVAALFFISMIWLEGSGNILLRRILVFVFVVLAALWLLILLYLYRKRY